MDPKQPETRLGREEIPSEERVLPARRVVVTERPTTEEPIEETNPSVGSSASRVRTTSPQTMSRGDLIIPRGNSEAGDAGGRVTATGSQVVEPSSADYAGRFDPGNAGKQSFGGKYDPGVRRLAGRLAGKLNERIAQGHATGPYIMMLFIAGLKDVMDFSEDGLMTLIQAIPGAGQVTAAIVDPLYSVVALLISAILAAFMQSQGWFFNQKLKLTHWGLSFLDVIPFIGSLPLQTISIMYVFKQIKKRGEKAEELQKSLMKMSQREMSQLDKSIEE